MGLSFFDSWVANYGNIKLSLEIKPEGNGYQMKTRLASFNNLPELMSMFRLVADIQTAEMLDLPVPAIVGGKATVVVTQRTEAQKQIMDRLVIRAERIRDKRVDKSQDNMLRITNEAKLMAIDPRLVDPLAENDPDSKLNTCVNDVYLTWTETAVEKLTQAIFCDSGTPKDDFNVYDEIKKCLIGKGIPKEEIAFVHDANNDSQWEILFEKVRTGEVRVIIGSTGKLGTGVNIQNKLIALNHLDVPWRPSDIAQRNGRGLRQGNNNENIIIRIYVAKDTFDSYLWQIQEQKLRHITQIMTGKSASRSCEDVDETVLSAAEIKAIATNNPLLLEKMTLDNEVERLKILRENWQNEHLRLQRDIESTYPNEITRLGKRIDEKTADLITVKASKTADFTMKVDGKIYTERTEAGDVLLTVINAKCKVGDNRVEVGEYCGLKIAAEFMNLDRARLYLFGKGSYHANMGESALGNITRLENLAERLPKMLEENKNELETAKFEFESAKGLVSKPFEFEEKLKESVAKQVEINTKLEFMQKNNNDEIGTEDLEEEEKSSDVADGQEVEKEDEIDIGA